MEAKEESEDSEEKIEVIIEEKPSKWAMLKKPKDLKVLKSKSNILPEVAFNFEKVP